MSIKMQGLSFDWDDVARGNETVESALQSLADDFGWTRVFYRISSSGTGLHVIIAELSLDMNLEQSLQPVLIEQSKIMEYRKKFADAPWNLECKGRFISDSARQKAGMRTSRVFSVKNQQHSAPWKNIGPRRS